MALENEVLLLLLLLLARINLHRGQYCTELVGRSRAGIKSVTSKGLLIRTCLSARSVPMCFIRRLCRNTWLVSWTEIPLHRPRMTMSLSWRWYAIMYSMKQIRKFTFLRQSGFRSREDKNGLNGLWGPLSMGLGSPCSRSRSWYREARRPSTSGLQGFSLPGLTYYPHYPGLVFDSLLLTASPLALRGQWEWH